MPRHRHAPRAAGEQVTNDGAALRRAGLVAHEAFEELGIGMVFRRHSLVLPWCFPGKRVRDGFPRRPCAGLRPAISNYVLTHSGAWNPRTFRPDSSTIIEHILSRSTTRRAREHEVW